MYSLKMPSRYLKLDASHEEIKIYTYYRDLIERINLGEKLALILPSDRDPETRQPLFELIYKGE